MKLPVLEKAPWFADGLSFTCTCCGNCCTGPTGYVWISDDEVRLLAEHLGLSEAETRVQYTRKLGGKISLKEKRSPQGLYDCIFLTELPDGKRVCGIYSVRPLQCRTWPFWEGNLRSQEDWDAAATRCPGMKGGKKYSLEQIEALRDAKEWPEAGPTSQRRKQGV